MGTDRVVVHEPSLGFFSCMVKVYEQPCVEDSSSVGAVEAFDKGVLCGFARLGEIQLDTVVRGPLTERSTGESRPVVKPDLPRSRSTRSGVQIIRSAVSEKSISIHNASRL